MQEIETKVLEVDVEEVSSKIEAIGAKKTNDVLLKVDWFSMPENPPDKQPWFLRVRSYSAGKIEVTWKGDLEVLGVSRKVKEINVMVEDHEKMKLLFEAIGLVVYAHQEKKRVSWELGNVKFDLDTYPNMPAYLEIEARSENEIKEMIEKLGLDKNQTWNDGERTLIEGKYKLNWSSMHF
jgi:adenylate cyclase class 2